MKFDLRAVAYADCDGTPAIIGLDESLVLKVTQAPDAILFRLSIRLAEDVTIYLQLEPRHIRSLNKTDCSPTSSDCPPRFDAICQFLGARSLAHLQFRLRVCGDLITPAQFDLTKYDDTARRTFEAVASLATAVAFSLYITHKLLPNRTYQRFEKAFQNVRSGTADLIKLQRMADFGRLYTGSGGVLLTFPTPVLDAAAATVATDPQRGRDTPPAYEYVEGCAPLLSTSQQSTASESDTTVAVKTPRRYDRERTDVSPPAYSQGTHTQQHICRLQAWSLYSIQQRRTCTIRSRELGPRGKHGLGGDTDVLQRPGKKRTRQPGVDGTPSQSQTSTTNLTSNTSKALVQDQMKHVMASMMDLRQRIDEQDADIAALRATVAVLQGEKGELEETVGSLHEQLQAKAADIEAHEVELVALDGRVLEINEDWKSTVEEVANSWFVEHCEPRVLSSIEEQVEKGMLSCTKEQVASVIIAEVKKRMRIAFTD